jgi:hypothetical protein
MSRLLDRYTRRWSLITLLMVLAAMFVPAGPVAPAQAAPVARPSQQAGGMLQFLRDNADHGSQQHAGAGEHQRRRYQERRDCGHHCGQSGAERGALQRAPVLYQQLCGCRIRACVPATGTAVMGGSARRERGTTPLAPSSASSHSTTSSHSSRAKQVPKREIRQYR